MAGAFVGQMLWGAFVTVDAGLLLLTVLSSLGVSGLACLVPAVDRRASRTRGGSPTVNRRHSERSGSLSYHSPAAANGRSGGPLMLWPLSYEEFSYLRAGC